MAETHACDLISRQAAIDAPVKMVSDGLEWVPVYHLKELPSAQRWIPVVHGHWKEDPSGYGFWICSVCGFVSEASAADMLYKFCPVCGARMDGKDGNDENA